MHQLRALLRRERLPLEGVNDVREAPVCIREHLCDGVDLFLSASDDFTGLRWFAVEHEPSSAPLG